MKYALLVDGSFMLRRLRASLRREPLAADVVERCHQIRASAPLRDAELLRILFYDAPAFEGRVLDLETRRDESLARTDVARRRTALRDQLALAPDFALRLGELTYEGFTLDRSAAQRIVREGRSIRPDDLRLRLTQKGVDLRIGLDIARLALADRVDAIAVVTGDSDFIPAFKFARREGLRVYLDHMGGPVRRELKVHADVILT